MFKYLDARSPLADASSARPLSDLQRALLHAMRAMERDPVVTMIDDGDVLETRSSVGVVVERLPVGKTAACEALMRDGPLPGRWGAESVRWELPYGALIQIDVTPIPVTVYVSDAEGINRIRERMHDRALLEILNARDAANFPLPLPENNLCMSDGSPWPDVILVKHGTSKTAGGYRESILGTLKRRLEGYAVARVVVDDFDSLRLSSADQLLPAAFTWLICRRQRQCVPANKMNTHPHMGSFLRADFYDNPLAQLCRDENIRAHFTITISRKFVERSMTNTILAEQFYIVRGAATGSSHIRRDPEALLRLLIKPVANELDADIRAQRLLDAGDIKRANKLVGGLKSAEDLAAVIAQRRSKHTTTIARLIDGVSEGECRCCMAEFSSAEGSSAEGSGTEGSSAEGSGAEGSGTEGSGASDGCVESPVVTVYHCCQAIVCADCAAYKLSKCPVCMKVLSGDYCSETLLSTLSGLDVHKFIESFPDMPYADTDPLVCAALALLRSEDPAPSLERMGGSIGIGSPGSYVRDLLGGRADRAAPSSRRRCVVFAPRKLRELIERELGIAGLAVETPDSVRRIREPHAVTEALLVSMASADRRRVVDELYNATGREYNLNITRLEFRTS